MFVLFKKKKGGGVGFAANFKLRTYMQTKNIHAVLRVFTLPCSNIHAMGAATYKLCVFPPGEGGGALLL